jgi:protein-S-isoprenylcysteine O-methyltransferase Ste14
MAPIPYVAHGVLLLGSAWLVFRVLVRRQYRRYGSLRWWATLLQLLVFCGWAYFGSLQYPATSPDGATPWLLRAVGWTLFVGGLCATLAAGVNLGAEASFGVVRPVLKVSGLYGVVRNPQAAAMGLALIGHTMVWPTWRCLGVMLLYVSIVHLMVITEEEHLARSLGAAYRVYRNQVPRYVPGRRRGRAC